MDIKKFKGYKMVKKYYCLCKDKNEEYGTYHLFECQREGIVLDICKKDENSFCEKLLSKKISCKFECLTLEGARIKIAELANTGENICGICVSMLYKNND